MLHENSRECAVEFPYHEVDGDPVQSPEFTYDDILETIRKVIRFVRTKDRARLTVDCIFLAVGDAEAETETMTSVAAYHGVTKAAVSKRTKEIRQQLHLSMNANNKSQRAVEQYANNRSPLRLAQ